MPHTWVLFPLLKLQHLNHPVLCRPLPVLLPEFQGVGLKTNQTSKVIICNLFGQPACHCHKKSYKIMLVPLKFAVLTGPWNCSFKILRRWNILRWPNKVFACVFANAIQHAHKDFKNKHGVNRAIILFNQHPRYLCYFSLQLNAVCSSLLWQRYVRKGNDAKNPAILSFCFSPKEPS